MESKDEEVLAELLMSVGMELPSIGMQARSRTIYRAVLKRYRGYYSCLGSPAYQVLYVGESVWGLSLVQWKELTEENSYHLAVLLQRGKRIDVFDNPNFESMFYKRCPEDIANLGSINAEPTGAEDAFDWLNEELSS